jgi:phage terminase large subunit
VGDAGKNMEWNPTLEPFQMEFFTSRARFPAMVAAWGTGKTMVALLKAMEHSIRYPGNLGLIVRKNFTDLKDSTMKDFTRYTGIRVPSSKDVKLANGSQIMFRHMDELSGVVPFEA